MYFLCKNSWIVFQIGRTDGTVTHIQLSLCYFVFYQEGKLEAEEFTSRLYKELNSSPQPYLVPFLKVSIIIASFTVTIKMRGFVCAFPLSLYIVLYCKGNICPTVFIFQRSLPALRQLTPDSAAFIQQSQLAQPASGSVSSTSTTPTTVVLGSPAPRLPTPVSRPLLQPGINKPGQMPSLVSKIHLDVDSGSSCSSQMLQDVLLTLHLTE